MRQPLEPHPPTRFEKDQTNPFFAPANLLDQLANTGRMDYPALTIPLHFITQYKEPKTDTG